MSNKKVRVAIVGVGNCANALVQGVTYYQDAPLDAEIPGLMHATVGGYHISDIEFVAAFDVNEAKVGLDLSEAIWAEPNNTIRFADVPNLGIIVQRGPTHDGLGYYVNQVVNESTAPVVDVASDIQRVANGLDQRRRGVDHRDIVVLGRQPFGDAVTDPSSTANDHFHCRPLLRH